MNAQLQPVPTTMPQTLADKPAKFEVAGLKRPTRMYT